MRSALARLGLGLAFAACSAAPAKPTTPMMATSSKCPQVADRMLAFYMQMSTPPPPAEMATLFHDVVLERCKQDVWKPAAQDCLLEPTSDMDTCTQFLTEQQKTSFQKQAEEKLIAAARAHAANEAGGADGGAAPSAVQPGKGSPPAPKVPSRRNPTSADPCEGGE